MSKRHPKIPADIDAELSPRARKFFGDMIDDYERRIAELMKRVEELEAKLLKMEAKLQKLTPKNSSIPPSTLHPHAKPAKPKNSKASGSGCMAK